MHTEHDFCTQHYTRHNAMTKMLVSVFEDRLYQTGFDTNCFSLQPLLLHYIVAPGFILLLKNLN